MYSRRRLARIVGALERDEAGALEQASEQVDVGRLVVDDQDAGVLEVWPASCPEIDGSRGD